MTDIEKPSLALLHSLATQNQSTVVSLRETLTAKGGKVTRADIVLLHEAATETLGTVRAMVERAKELNQDLAALPQLEQQQVKYVLGSTDDFLEKTEKLVQGLCAQYSFLVPR